MPDRTAPRDRVTVQTPAKINLSLAVGSPREDGYHPLATVYQAVGLFDRVTAVLAPDEDVTLALDPSSPLHPDELTGVPTDERNLAVRAARLLAEQTGVPAGVRLSLRKAIPVAGGLAGGSSDAAAALLACNQLWGTGLSTDDLLALAARVGSDVPFCLVGGTALGHGRGERVTPVLTHGKYHWVLAVDRRGLSTPAVYAELDRIRAGMQRDGLRQLTDLDVPDELVNALRNGDLRGLGAAMFNDLQSAALSLRPDLDAVLELQPAVDSCAALVSGSGPTVLFLAQDAADAARICRALGAAGCRALPAVGPVPGARVVRS
jgi:4-diphosphocytidyl-2-C-methyl-D-erythritol kinase